MINTTITTNDTTNARHYMVSTGRTCPGNRGPGGWGAQLNSCEGCIVKRTKQLSGVKRTTTSLEMELIAAIKALSWLPLNDVPVIVQSDSQYLIKGMTEWMPNWEKNGWATSDGKRVKNEALWRALVDAMGTRPVTWEWVRSGSGHEGTEAARKLAIEALARAFKPRCS